jgi:hypothetical protein
MDAIEVAAAGKAAPERGRRYLFAGITRLFYSTRLVIACVRIGTPWFSPYFALLALYRPDFLVTPTSHRRPPKGRRKAYVRS